MTGGMLPKLRAAFAAASARPAMLVKIAAASGRDAILAALDDRCGTSVRLQQEAGHG